MSSSSAKHRIQKMSGAGCRTTSLTQIEAQMQSKKQRGGGGHEGTEGNGRGEKAEEGSEQGEAFCR